MRTSRDRFFGKVQKTGGCWLWTGAKVKSHAAEYGKCSYMGALLLAHRASYEMHIGKIPNGLIVMHTCDTPLCVNPDHLVVGTHKDNSQDAARKDRITFGENCYTSKLTDNAVRRIKAIKGVISGYRAAKIFGVTDEIIYRIWRGEIWRRTPNSLKIALA